MPEVLRIRALVRAVSQTGVEGGYLAFDLRHLLALVNPEGPNLRWHAIPMGEDFFVTGNGEEAEAAIEWCNRVDDFPEGRVTDWHSLRAMGDQIFQTIWGTFIALRPEVELPPVPSLFQDSWHYLDRATDAFYRDVEIAFQAVDSSFWLVWAKDEDVRNRIRNAFEDVVST